MRNWKKHLLIAAVVLVAATVLGGFLAEPLWAQIRAALTKDVDNPARQPFNAANGLATFTAGATTLVDPILTVPAGKRAVVEHCSCVNFLDSANNWIRIELVFTSAGVTNTLQEFVHTRVGQSFVAGIDVWSLSQPVRLYADPSTTVNVRALRRAGSGDGGVECYLSGHYVDTAL